MKILVDADACPVKSQVVSIAKELGLPVWMYIDTSHILQDEYAVVVTVDRARDSTDMAIVNQLAPGDVVVTQDYGLASLTLGKKAFAIHPSGLVFTPENINRLLFERYLSQKVRRAGGKTPNPRKRTPEDDGRFAKAFRELCKTAVSCICDK